MAAFAVLASLIDWKQAFPRQDPTLGVQSFIDNGVRGALVPVLVYFFKDKVMSVKWHQKFSSSRNLSGGGPKGATLGFLEYLSQSNDNANHVEPELRFKWMDDFTILEVVNLLTIGISSFNIKQQVPNDIPISNGFVLNKNMVTQEYIDKISDWTTSKKMMLNQKKSHLMCFNFTQKYQFTSRITMGDKVLPVVKQTKLLGVVVTDDLKWTKNT